VATDQTPPGAARIVKTARSAVTLTAGQQLVHDVLWPTPFTDDAYTVSLGIEYPALDAPTVGNAIVESFVRKADHSGISVDVENADSSNPIDVVIHATAIHD
jgi:hypothetical protein